jgi:hypothetical protein
VTVPGREGLLGLMRADGPRHRVLLIKDFLDVRGVFLRFGDAFIQKTKIFFHGALGCQIGPVALHAHSEFEQILQGGLVGLHGHFEWIAGTSFRLFDKGSCPSDPLTGPEKWSSASFDRHPAGPDKIRDFRER